MKVLGILNFLCLLFSLSFAADAGQTLVERKHFDLETLKQHINDAVSS